MGAPSLPMLRAGLERLESRLDHPGATALAEDLIIVATASLLAIGRDATLVVERWRKSTTLMRTRLEAILRHDKRHL